MVNAYQLSVTVSLLPFASLGELRGYRRVFVAGLAVFTLGSLGCALSGSLTMLVASRILQGFGGAGLISVNTALLRFIYPADQLGRRTRLVRHRFDWLSASLSAATFGALITASTIFAGCPQTSCSQLAGAAVASALFVWRQRLLAYPMLAAEPAIPQRKCCAAGERPGREREEQRLSVDRTARSNINRRGRGAAFPSKQCANTGPWA